MKFFPLICALALTSSVEATPLVITEESSGFLRETIESTTPKAGIVLTREVTLPAFEKGAYYRPHSRSIASGNRVEAVAFDTLADLQNYSPSKTRKGHNLIKDGQFILLQISEGNYLALLPMTSSEVYGQFYIEKETLILKTGNYGTDPVEGDIPLLIWSYGDSPYAATRSVWEQVIDSGLVATDWRMNKEYPEMYDYLGWCSWEFYKKTINEEILVNAVHTLEKTEAPIRWMIVDDGYFNLKKSLLNTLDPVAKKFPNGWKTITDLKTPEKIKWMGIWRHSGGAMAGINPAHSMEHLKPHLAKTKGNGLLPNGTAEGSAAFYDYNMRDAKENGFDFTKVDFQAKTFELLRGTSNAVQAMRHNNEALENAAKNFDIPLLNCIAQPNINSLQTKYSALTRSSPDYNQSDKNKNKCNTYQSFANHLWMGQSVWGDLDMFHTHDKRDIKSMAIARAISGGPVYISDEPSKIVPEELLPFAFVNGKLLRSAAPATLLPESFFIHPFRDEEVFRVVAPLEDDVAAIALFNFAEANKPLSSGFTAKDYSHAGELLQPNNKAWTTPEQGLLVYDQLAKTVVDLGEGFSTEVSDFSAQLFLLYPKTKGWAVIGRSDKYLPAAAVKIQSLTDKQITFTLKESGPLTVWSNSGTPKMDGATFESIGENLYQANLPITPGELEITLTR